MTLEVCIALRWKSHYVTRKIRNPSNEDIAKALKFIGRGYKWSYIILSKPQNGYFIQTDVFALEYKNGSDDEHYFCSPEYLTSELILDAFLSYAEENSWWKEQVIWRKGYGI